MQQLNPAEIFVDYFRTFMQVADDKAKSFGELSEHPTGWAASFESLFLFKLEVQRHCSARDALILDAGSGVSSAVLRVWFDNVITCDNDRHYMANVRRTCEALTTKFQAPRLSDGGWVDGYYEKPVDSVFYDFGNFDVRREMLPTALGFVKNVAYLDDIDHRDRAMALRGTTFWEGRAKGFALRDVHEAIDEFGRWGVMATRVK